LQKNISHMSKSVKQMEIDIRNAQQDKSAPPNDRFLHVMTISFSANEQSVIFVELSELRLTLTCSHVLVDLGVSMCKTFSGTWGQF